VLLNASQLSGGMGELLTLSDIVVGSERFANELAPSDELAHSLREITRLGPRIAVITMGEAGAVALEGSKLVQQDAIDVFVEDTTARATPSAAPSPTPSSSTGRWSAPCPLPTPPPDWRAAASARVRPDHGGRSDRRHEARLATNWPISWAFV